MQAIALLFHFCQTGEEHSEEMKINFSKNSANNLENAV